MVLIMSSDEEIEVNVIYIENVEKDAVQDVLYHHVEEKFYQRTYRNLCLKFYPELEQQSPLEGDHKGIQLPTHTVISDDFSSETELYNDFPQFEDEDTGEIDETAYLEKTGASNKDIITKRMTNEQIAKAQELSQKCLDSGYKDC